MGAASAIGDIVSSLTSGMASAAQYQAAKHERNVSWRRQQAWELMAPSLRVEGLKRAGLNPILAATQGMTGGPGHVATASPGGSPSFRFDAEKMVSTARQARSMASQVKILENEAQRTYHAAGKAAEEWSTQEEQTKFLREHTQNLIAERGLTSAKTAETEAMRMRIMTDNLLMSLGIPGARAMESLYQSHPWLRQVREFGGGNLVGSAVGLGSAAAIGAGGYAAGKWRERPGFARPESWQQFLNRRPPTPEALGPGWSQHPHYQKGRKAKKR